MIKKLGQNGFSAAEGLLILVLVALLGFVGWYVWHSRQNANTNYNTAANNNNTTTVTTPASAVKWIKYSDDFASFSYPNNWKVKRDDNTSLPGTKELYITGPKRKVNGMEVAPGITLFLLSKLFLTGTTTCTNCGVYGLQKTDNSSAKGSLLIFTQQKGPGWTKFTTTDVVANSIELVDNQNIKVGDKTFGHDYVTFGSRKVAINVSTTSFPGIKSNVGISGIIASREFQDEVKILNSLAIKQ